MKKETRKNKKQLNKYIRFSGIALQMGITIYLFNKIGGWLDVKFVNKKHFFLNGLTLFGVFVSIYAIIKGVINLSKDND